MRLKNTMTSTFSSGEVGKWHPSPSSNHPVRPLPASEVYFASLGKADTLWLMTENSTYQFTIISTLDRKGILTGGRLGKGLVEAIVGAHSPSGGQSLRVGDRATFLVGDMNKGDLLTTSRIKRLIHERSAS